MKTKTLLEAISMILPAVDNKGLVPEFQYLYFTKTHVEATDGALFIRADLEEECPEFCVDAGVFHSLLKTITDPEVEIKLKEKVIVLKTKTIKTKLARPEKSLKSAISFDVKGWKPLPDGLLPGLFLCRYTACPDQTAGALVGVRIEDGAVLSCDRWRVSMFSTDIGDIKPEITIPVQVIDQITRYQNRIEGVLIENGCIYFKLQGAKIGAKLIEGDYPAEALIGSLDQIEGAVNLPLSDDLKAGIAEASKRQNIIQNSMLEFDRTTDFTVEKKKLKLFSSNEAVGTVEEVLDCKGAKDAAFSFAINPVFLLKMFEETTSLVYSKESNIAAFQGDNFVHLVKTKTPPEDE